MQLAPSEPPHAVRELADLSTSILDGWHGMGEERGGVLHNNRGPAIEGWRSMDGTGKRVGGAGDWCAVVQCAADMQAARALGYRLPWKPSRGAKRYMRNVADSGGRVFAMSRRRNGGPVEWFDDPARVPMGAIIAWHRGGWRGHVERWIELQPDGTLITMGGNKNNRRDSKGRPYAVVGYHARSADEWRRRLAGVVAQWSMS